MGRAFVLCTSLSLMLILLLAPVVLAEDEPAKITADELTYDYHMKQMEATGKVRIIYKNITIESDKAFIDQKQNVLLASGNVHITKKDSSYIGESFLYYMLSEEGLLTPVTATLHDKEINGPAYLSSNGAIFKGETVDAKKSTFTGCDLAASHYHFTAKEIEYYPEDRIVMHQVWYWEHKVPLFYLPIFFISLKHEDDNLEVEVGHNESEGWFTKIGYGYILNKDSYGKITTRLTEKAGNELDVTHYFDLNSTSRFSQNYGFVDKSKQGYSNPDFDFGFGYENRTNSKFLLKTTCLEWNKQSNINVPLHQERYFNLDLTGQSPYPTIGVKFKDNNETDDYTYDLKSNWNYSPEPTFNIYLNNDWLLTKNAGEIGNSFQYVSTISKNWGWSNLLFNYKDMMVYSGGFSIINLKPDILYTIPKWKWPGLGDISVNSQYTHQESIDTIKNTIKTGDRWALDLQKIPVNLWQTQHLTLNLQSKFFYRDFLIDKNENEFYALSSDLGLTDSFTKEFSTEVRVGYKLTDGLSNTFFKWDDKIEDGAYLTNEWKWQSLVFNASLRSGYNFKYVSADPVVLQSRWNPGPGREIYFDTIYNWIGGLGMTNLRINYSPRDNWRLNLNVGYNFVDNAWTNKEFEALLTQQIAPKWQMEIAAKYNMLGNAFEIAETGLVYDWHCRKVKLHYNWIRQEYQLRLVFNAFPDSPLDFSSESGFEGLIDNAVNKL